MRWVFVTPLGVAHRVMEDDVYKGYLIPKGSVINVVSSRPMNRNRRHVISDLVLECLVRWTLLLNYLFRVDT